MSIKDKQVGKTHKNCKHWGRFNETLMECEQERYPCCECENYDLWKPKDKSIVVEKQKDTATSPVKDQCETCRKTFPACNGTITIMPQTGHLECLSWAPRPAPDQEKTREMEKRHGNCRWGNRFNNGDPYGYPCTVCRDYDQWEPEAAVVERLEDPDLVEVNASLACPLDHTALAAAHWDGFTGPLIDHVAEAVKTITQLGGEEDETDRAIDAVVKALRFMALSHWVHGAKHEREAK